MDVLFSLLRLGAGLVLPPVLGWLLLGVLRGQRLALSRLEVAGLSWALGWGLLTLEMPLLVLAGLRQPWQPLPLTVLWGTTALVLALGRALLGREGSRAAQGQAAVRRPHSRSVPGRLLEAGAIVLVVVQVGIVAMHAVAWPVHDLDAWSIWALKARIFYLSQGIPPAYFHDASRLFSHPDYPLLVPLAETWLYGWLGRADDWSVMVIFPPFLAALLAVVGGTLGRLYGRAAGLAGAAALVCVPYLVERAGAGDADVPLALMAAASTTCLWLWLRDEQESDQGRRALLLAGLLGGLGAWTKKEGAILLALSALVVVVAAWRRAGGRPGRAAGMAAVFVVPALLVAGPWLAFLALAQPLTRDFLPVTPATFLAHADRLPTIALFSGLRLLDVRRWNAVWLLLAATALLARRRWRAGPLHLLLILLVLQLAADGALFVFSDWQPYTAHLQTALDRLLLHSLPLAVLLLAALGAEGPLARGAAQRAGEDAVSRPSLPVA